MRETGSAKRNTIKRATVTRALRAENDGPAMLWALANAWPTRISGTDLKASGNAVAIESIVIAHEVPAVVGPRT